MTELFTNLSEQFKKNAKFMVDRALQQNNLIQAFKIIESFSQYCSEEERDFLMFYLNLQKEKIKNENNYD